LRLLPAVWFVGLVPIWFIPSRYASIVFTPAGRRTRFKAVSSCAMLGCGAPVGHRRRRYRPHIAFRLHRMAFGGVGRTSMVHRRKLGAVRPCRLGNLLLGCHGTGVRLSPCLNLGGPWPRLDPTRSAVVAIPVVMVIDASIVVVVHAPVVDVICGPVVVEVVVVPVSALVTVTGIAVAVVDSTVIADVRAPIPWKELVTPVSIAPVSRSP
jgi:hypothetical protein